MVDKHRIENEGWINARKEELKEERKQLEIDKVSVPLCLSSLVGGGLVNCGTVVSNSQSDGG